MNLLMRFRFLLVVVVLAGSRAMWEIATREHTEPAGSSVPISDLISELHPELPAAAYRRGIVAQFVHKDYVQARESYELALAMGLKTNETLFHQYIEVLIHLGEDDETVEAAVQNWRWNFPNSRLPDPRNRPNFEFGQAVPHSDASGSPN